LVLMSSAVAEDIEPKSSKPSFIRKVPIDQAEFLSDGFDSFGRLYPTLDDGGVQLSTNDTEIFPILLLDFQSWSFYHTVQKTRR
jgi:hypothetical protein